MNTCTPSCTPPQSHSVLSDAFDQSLISLVVPNLQVMKVPHFYITLSEDFTDNAKYLINQVLPHWPVSAVKFSLFTEGITNKLVKCTLESEDIDGGKPEIVLIRIYGKNTNLLIDRTREMKNFKLLYENGYGPKLYATFQNGLMYDYIPGVPLTKDSVRAPSVFPLVAKMMAKMHLIKDTNQLLGPCVPVLFERLFCYYSLIPSEFSTPELQKRYNECFPKGSAFIIEEITFLKHLLEPNVDSVVLCHNDLLLANIIHNESKNEVRFIDYEYAAYNFQSFDIGNHFLEFAGISDVDYSLYPDKEFQLIWIKDYLTEYNAGCNKPAPTSEEIESFYERVNKFALASHLIWGLWALVQAHNSAIDFDYIEYAKIRLNEYFRTKPKVIENFTKN